MEPKPLLRSEHPHRDLTPAFRMLESKLRHGFPLDA
jgi:hypothetical protein